MLGNACIMRPGMTRLEYFIQNCTLVQYVRSDTQRLMSTGRQLITDADFIDSQTDITFVSDL